MVGFFTGLMIVGMSFIFISVIMVMYDRKKDQEERNEIISVRDELKELLEDSNDMVNELNRFSDYVISKVDEKCSEFKSIVKQSSDNKSPEQNIVVARDLKKNDIETVVDNLTKETVEEITISNEMAYSEEIEPAILEKEAANNGLNPKHTEVIRLFEQGMSDSDIAKALNMGKGEIQLIVGLNLHKLNV